MNDCPQWDRWCLAIAVALGVSGLLHLAVLAVDCVVEVGGSTLQAWRNPALALDTETPFDAAVATVLAVGGGVLVVVLGAFAVMALRGRVSGAESMRLAVRAGFLLLVVGLLAGAR